MISACSAVWVRLIRTRVRRKGYAHAHAHTHAPLTAHVYAEEGQIGLPSATGDEEPRAPVDLEQLRRRATERIAAKKRFKNLSCCPALARSLVLTLHRFIHQFSHAHRTRSTTHECISQTCTSRKEVQQMQGRTERERESAKID